MFSEPFPTEIIFYILNYVLDNNSSDTETISKPPWAVITGFSVASKKFRAIALQAWFHIFCVRSDLDWGIVSSKWPKMYLWVRILHIRRGAIDFLKTDITPFTRLHTLCLDFPGPGSDHVMMNEVWKVLENIPATIRALEIYGLSWPEPMLLKSIVNAVPELRILSLRQPMIWCGLCNTCSISELKEPFPELLVYEKGIGLPLHYARLLSPLEQLHTVKLTVAVGDGNISLDAENANIWTGECELCMERLYTDESFRTQWVEKKRKAEPRPPGLKRVEWRLLGCAEEHWSDFLAGP